MKKKLTVLRLIAAVVSMALEQVAIYAVWRWLLPLWGVSLGVWVVILAMSAWFVIGIFLFIAGTNALCKKEVAGLSTMVGMAGITISPLSPLGTVKINGEIWTARAESDFMESGESIIVIGEDGLKLVVRRKK